MSPEGRAPSPLGPLARDRYKRASKFASLALVVAAGLVTPTVAAARSHTPHTTAAHGGDCEHRAGLPGGDHDKDKCPKPRPTYPTASPTETKPPSGCFDIDSVVHGDTKYISVVCNGQVYVLTVAETGTDAGHAVSGWLPVGGPNNVIDATLAERDAVVYVSVLTANGQVQEGTCTTASGQQGPGRPINVPCTFVTDFPTPPAS
ncbi:hypothetical protein AB0N14_13050 [Streptomyces sp. NPDC051104]|uniref:hypothetical protein n=1 Tax=Streptomyces sp. NPDC051104 TaxID=3155044 RepID=UPI003419FB96